jgi:hypothetical protein
MITKSLIAAGAVIASLATFAPVQQAEAKVHIDVGVGLGVGGFYPGYPGYGYGYGYGYAPVVDPYYGGGYGISCGKGRKIVKWAGFYNVNPMSCGGPVFIYEAWKAGNPYKVKVNMDGDIIKVKPLY